MNRHKAVAPLAAMMFVAAIAWGQGQAHATDADGWEAEKQALAAKGRQYETAWELYQALKQKAEGGQKPGWEGMPDWSGVYTREASPFFFDPDQAQTGRVTAKLKPDAQAVLDERLDLRAQGIEYDPISACGTPPGVPRWLTEPFLREFAVTPGQTWMINEMMNDVRRVYTDGRGHPPEADRYPLYNGDSIGFWDGGRLIFHTNQLRDGIYQRGQPDYSDQAETVEIWRKVDERTIEADVWVYDPVNLAEPWFTRQRYIRLTNDDKALRIRYWACSENPNNEITKTEDGASTFTDFGFTDVDDE